MSVRLSAQRTNPADTSAAGSPRTGHAHLKWPVKLGPRGVATMLPLLLAAAAWSASPAALPSSALPPATSTSDNTNGSKPRLLMAQAQSPHSDTKPSAAGTGYTKAITPERLQERTVLLRTGEAALARLDLDTAISAFDRAALIQHAADTELSLVRAYMQGGQYRRALASGAHTAGAHLDVVAGPVLYAWLLSAGGQDVIGQRLLDEAHARMPRNPVVISVRQQLRSGAPVATGILLNVPLRLAPYSSGPALPHQARVVGSGLLLASGQQALVPMAALPKAKSPRLWVRNGMGALSAATVLARMPKAGVVLLELGTALPVANTPGVAATEAFPGSAGFAVEYTANRTTEAAWPLLRTGFLGGLTGSPAKPEERALGISMPPGPRGGPVFDVAGRLIGLALTADKSPSRTSQTSRTSQKTLPILVSASALRRELTKVAPTASLGAAPAAPSATPGRVPLDVIYENALKTTLQVIALP